MPAIIQRDVPPGGRGTDLYVVSIVMSTVSVIFVALRMVTRMTILSHIRSDDYVIMASTVISSPFC